MSKYILDPSGKIIKNGVPVNAGEVTQEILEKQVDYFTVKNRGGKPIVGLTVNNFPVDLKDNNGISDYIKESETPVFENESIFPQKKNSQDVENFLINSSFGADNPIEYYTPYNSAFSEKDINKRIYAEELEMIAGVDLNSLGLIASPNGTDLSLVFYTLDYLISSIAYLATYWVFIDPLKNSNIVPTPIKNYFNKLLPLRSEMKDKGFLTLISCFAVGFDKYINTDPKWENILNDLDKKDNSKYRDNNILVKLQTTFELIFTNIFNSVLSLSKVGRNRFFILTRKFQQEAYWHNDLLYKAKDKELFSVSDVSITAENFLDKFFIEFSQYYFKFMLERINIGYLTLYKNELFINSKIPGSGLNKLDTHSRLWDPSRTGFDKEKDKKDQEKRIFANDYFEEFDEDGYEFLRDVNTDSKFKTSINSLPQLLKSNKYLQQKLKFLDIVNNESLSRKFAIQENLSSKRIPQKIVKSIEKELGKEYMPFYLHDLRTNEIVAMHAFLDSISDSFSPEYTSSSGYGRIDDVKHYVKTSRSINLTFLLYSMEEGDFDLMWYQVNKIVSMVYPQWSQGIPSNNEKLGKDFRFPFTQVPTASPLIRLRVGDVIKSNYSKENLKRLHGNKIITQRGSIPVKENSVAKEITAAEIDGKTNNPYTKAFETSGGQGLAGFITNLGVDFQEYVWNTNMPGSNAPHGVKITLGFAPIHDIPPGLDHNGLMRSAVYGVGKINKVMFEDD